MEDLARAGFMAKGVVYLLIGVLPFQAAAGSGGAVTGPEGALLTRRQPAGRILLGLTAVGLSAYSLWRLFCAVFDPEPPLMEMPLGPYLVAAVALGVAGYGVAQVVRGLGRKAAERLRLGELDPDQRRLVIRVGRVGLVARGVVFGIIGICSCARR